MTYIDHVHEGWGAGGARARVILHSWADFTEARLRWLYGDAHATTRAAKTNADLAAWKRLGGKPAGIEGRGIST